MVVTEHSSAHGIAMYVKQGTSDVSVIESSTNNNIYTSVMRAGPLSITNVYKPPQADWNNPLLNIQPHPALYAGDFNSHHTEWGYNSNDENGEAVITWASINELQLVRDAKDRKTFLSKIWNTETNPDLCFVSADNEGIRKSIDVVAYKKSFKKVAC